MWSGAPLDVQLLDLLLMGAIALVLVQLAREWHLKRQARD
jgi:uncharacterized integral membrane protein